MTSASFSVESDPRVELISIVESLASGNPCPLGEKSDYLERVVRSFDPKHAACRRFAAMTEQDWRHKHPSLVMLDFSPPPELAVEAFKEHYEGRGREDAILKFVKIMREFAESQSFGEFFAAQKKARQALLAPAEESLGAKGLDRLIRDYLGALPPYRYHFIMAPLYHGPVMHNILYRRPKGAYEIYSISGHSSSASGEAQCRFDPGVLRRAAWHELAHTVIDDITQAHRETLLPLSPLYGMMSGLAKEKYRGPQGWLHMVDEHVIRALTSRLEALENGEAAGLRAMEKERADGFALIGPVYQSLIEYEKTRGRHASIAEFYPRIAKTLARLFKRGLPAPR